ncbi:DNA-binding response regulator [Paenibacillus sp. BGI2013]|uniref:response regulator transcription factor n=1 Tax=Paenibacillus TaxID=44249 RepID=UPI00096BF1DF|nr:MULTISPECIES: response regulator [Paenibacillus]OMF39935.1 DNA-binding response regulator [Paenibacillus amylolyticus]PKQ88099.1 DNA-binding response regulator [Paenibacillus sp. BGI2013]
MYKVLLVEDETVIRQGLRELIVQVSSQFQVTGEASSGTEALDFLRCEVPDVLITDIRMREMDGLTLVSKARDMYPELLMLIISGYGEFEYARRAMGFGVLNYLLKPIDRYELALCIQKIQLLLDRRYGISTLSIPEPSGKTEHAAGDTRKIIRDVKEHIKQHPDGDLRLQTIADLVNLNPTYLSQLFKNEIGINYSEYITEARMERAKWLLINTGLKIYDVARLSGHQSPKHFMLVFKQQVGWTAGEYRDRFSIS